MAHRATIAASCGLGVLVSLLVLVLVWILVGTQCSWTATTTSTITTTLWPPTIIISRMNLDWGDLT